MCLYPLDSVSHSSHPLPYPAMPCPVLSWHFMYIQNEYTLFMQHYCLFLSIFHMSYTVPWYFLPAHYLDIILNLNRDAVIGWFHSFPWLKNLEIVRPLSNNQLPPTEPASIAERILSSEGRMSSAASVRCVACTSCSYDVTSLTFSSFWISWCWD